MDYERITMQTYDKVAKTWEKKRPTSWEQVKLFLEAFENKKNLLYLDLGCGAGRDLECAKNLGYEKIVGCDYSKGQIDLIKQKGFTGQVASITDLPYKGEFFDIITCVAAFHHLLNRGDQLIGLEEIQRILKPKAKLLLVNWFPTKEYIENQVSKGKFEFVKENIVKVTFDEGDGEKHDRYYYLFKEEEILDLCSRAGFKGLDKFYEDSNLYLVLEKE